MLCPPPRYQAGEPRWSKTAIRCKLPVLKHERFGIRSFSLLFLIPSIAAFLVKSLALFFTLQRCILWVFATLIFGRQVKLLFVESYFFVTLINYIYDENKKNEGFVTN